MVACGDAGKSYPDNHKDTVVTKVFAEIAQEYRNDNRYYFL